MSRWKPQPWSHWKKRRNTSRGDAGDNRVVGVPPRITLQRRGANHHPTWGPACIHPAHSVNFIQTGRQSRSSPQCPDLPICMALEDDVATAHLHVKMPRPSIRCAVPHCSIYLIMLNIDLALSRLFSRSNLSSSVSSHGQQNGSYPYRGHSRPRGSHRPHRSGSQR